MSTTKMRWVLNMTAVHGSAKHILTLLAYHHNEETGRCFPSRKTLMQEAGISKSTLKRALTLLETTKLLRIEKPSSTQRSRFILLSDPPERSQMGKKNPPNDPKNCPKKGFDMNPQKVQNEPIGDSIQPLKGVKLNTIKEEKERERNLKKADAEKTTKNGAGTGMVAKPIRTVGEVIGDTQLATPLSCEEVVEYYEERSATPKLLEFFWRALLVRRFESIHSTVSFTQRELGQIKTLYAKWPEGKFHKAIDSLFREWAEFGEYVKICWGGVPIPMYPTVGALLRQVQAGVSYLDSAVNCTPEVVPLPKPKVHLPTPHSNTWNDEVPITIEEILALEKKYDARKEQANAG